MAFVGAVFMVEVMFGGFGSWVVVSNVVLSFREHCLPISRDTSSSFASTSWYSIKPSLSVSSSLKNWSISSSVKCLKFGSIGYILRCCDSKCTSVKSRESGRTEGQNSSSPFGLTYHEQYGQRLPYMTYLSSTHPLLPRPTSRTDKTASRQTCVGQAATLLGNLPTTTLSGRAGRQTVPGHGDISSFLSFEFCDNGSLGRSGVKERPLMCIARF